MKHNLIIDSRGKSGKKRFQVRPSLPYQAIARRFTGPITYDTEIDISAFLK